LHELQTLLPLDVPNKTTLSLNIISETSSLLFISLHSQLMDPCLGEPATRTQLLARFKTAHDQLRAPEELATERLTKMVPLIENIVQLKIARKRPDHPPALPRKRPDHPPARPESTDNRGRLGKRKQPESLEIQRQDLPVYVAPSQRVRSSFDSLDAEISDGNVAGDL
jgi:hypothetical protein